MTQRDDDRDRLRPRAAAEGEAGAARDSTSSVSRRTSRASPQRLERRFRWRLGPPVHSNVTQPVKVPDSFRAPDRRGQRTRHGALRVRAQAAAQAELAMTRQHRTLPSPSSRSRAPERIAVGRGTAFVIGGLLLLPAERTRALAGASGRLPAACRALPAAARRRSTSDSRRATPLAPNAYRSGFVAFVDVAPVDRAAAARGRARPHHRRRERGARPGRRDRGRAGSPPADGRPAARFPDRPGPRVAICMATYEPPGDLLRIQLDSIREQTHGNWVCLISDDHSSDEPRTSGCSP